MHPGGEGFGLVRHDGQIARIRLDDGTLVEDVVPTGPSLDVVPVGRPANALSAPEGCPPFPFDGPRPTAGDAQTGAPADASHADNPLRAKLPTAAAKALADDADGCLGEVTAGDFGRKGGDDFLVRVHECEAEDAYWNVLLVSTAGGRYDALTVPSIGTGGEASFDTHRSGKPVILIEDDCCAHHLVTVVKKRDGELTEILEAHAVEPDRVEILRDEAGRIRKLRVEKG